MTHWSEFLSRAWPALVQGDRVSVPPHLGHPVYGGFRYLPFAQGEGQVRDWVISFQDGSRVHVHEMPDGSLVAHRDRHDPQRGVVSALRHVATETRAGRVAAVGGIVYGVSRIASRLL